MIALLLLVIPFVTGLVTFSIKNEKAVKSWSLGASVLTLVIALAGVYSFVDPAQLSFDASWLPALGSRFSIGLDGMGKMLCLLNAVAFVVVFAAVYKNTYKRPGSVFCFFFFF
jgi:NADH-quinone oxidoreductase subunit M